MLKDLIKQLIEDQVKKYTSDPDLVDLNLTEEVRTVKVPKPKCYSMFEYIQTSDYYGTRSEEDDNKPIKFLIPCGFEWDESAKYWFITFPLNGTDEDIVEFYTEVNPLQL